MFVQLYKVSKSLPKSPSLSGYFMKDIKAEPYYLLKLV